MRLAAATGADLEAATRKFQRFNLPIQFGLRNLPLAAVDILVVWETIVWMMLAIWPHARLVAAAQVPYFVWVSIATVLQLSITWMNRA